MHNANIPDYTELPSSAKLIRSTIIAIIIATVILVTLVLPAEFGIDPTGVGKLTGLKRMGEIKQSLNDELNQERTDSTAQSESPSDPASITADANQPDPTQSTNPINEPRSDQLSVNLAPNQSTEIKITMTEGTAVEFSWSTNQGQAFYDLHGDSSAVNYHIYEKGTDSTKQGTLTAAFTGNHGWYWKNRTQSPITITLKAQGKYQAIKEMK